MKPTAPPQTRKVGRLQCDQCGHACSRSDFIRGWNLCDHLSLDALAAAQSRREKRILWSENPLRHFSHNDLLNYPFSQGLMDPEFLFLGSQSSGGPRELVSLQSGYPRVGDRAERIGIQPRMLVKNNIP